MSAVTFPNKIVFTALKFIFSQNGNCTGIKLKYFQTEELRENDFYVFFFQKLLEDVLQQNKGANGERGKTGGPGNVTQHR